MRGRTVARALVMSTLAAGVLAAPAWANDDEQRGLKLNPLVTQVDWSQAKELVVELGDHTYTPNELRLKRGVPYKLMLKNVGGQAHDMVGGTFFSKEVIALRMVNSRVGRVTADNISSIYVRPKNETEIWFLPIKSGTFSFICSLPGHLEAGMEGSVRIDD